MDANIHPAEYTVILDSSVLVPGFLSNLLLWLSHAELFKAHWTNDIHEEWMRGRRNRYQHNEEILQKRRRIIDSSFPQGLVSAYESVIESLSLPDKDDRHVLAAAIVCGANAIVTSNLKDFPASKLEQYNLIAITQDDFIMDHISRSPLNSRLVAVSLIRHKKAMTKSHTSWKAYFSAMSREGVGLRKTHKAVNTPEFKQLIGRLLKTEEWCNF